MEIVENRKARFNYEILDEVEAGVVLLGTEVKSLRQKKANISDAYAVFHGNELFLVNSKIEPYSHAGMFQHEPTRARKLLLHQKELARLKGKLSQRGYTLLPLKLYFNKRGKVKVLLALARGKKTHDKRQAIKERDLKREMERELKGY
ncbi:MAG: SsrA-binding protein SmpB [Leptospiraceae bacterium]|nr:SsrA-binding protein SmpB [Leptospiraceae bacterium]MDW8306007.1 SsrA-binding protein SmpB [Leptospiraceae bacterium]